MPSPDLSTLEPTRYDGAAVLDEVVDAFRTYCVLPTPAAYPALALYVAYTHAADCFQYAPRLLITSAEKRSGKSRVLDIVAALANRPLISANATVAAIFRTLSAETMRTVVFDEADTIFGTKVKAEQNEDLRGLINAGFMRGTPVLRCEGPTHTPVEFEVFGPVVMAAIGRLPDTITDRAVNIRIKRRKKTEKVKPYRLKRDGDELRRLSERLAVWVESIKPALGVSDPSTPLEDRAADLWEPLIAVADEAGGRWPVRAREAALELTRAAAEDDEAASPGIELLRDLRDVLEFMKRDFVPTSDTIRNLEALEDSRWQGEGLTGKRLADMLRPYGVKAKSDGKARGYRRADLEDAFARYLSTPTIQVSEASTSAPASGTSADASLTLDRSKRQVS